MSTDVLDFAKVAERTRELEREVERWTKRNAELERRLAGVRAAADGVGWMLVMETLAEMRGADSVTTFAAAMIEKLARCADKPHWSTQSQHDLRNGLYCELSELHLAMMGSDAAHVMEEAVDVANMAMMIFDNARAKKCVRCGAPYDGANCSRRIEGCQGGSE